MMKQTNMKQIKRLILLTVALLVFLLFCTDVFVKQHRGLHGGIQFEVDGTKYWVSRCANVDQQGHVASSSLRVSFRDDQTGGTSEYASRRGTTIVRFHLDGGDVIAKTDTLYFIQNRKIVFEKSYQELGIDASRLNAELDETLDYLQPLLETMIREHVPPQEPETEEEL